ncbi:MAG: hypothetical protein KGL39_03765 [Patescibacteria group bacterium]|nr:hypothetical protein [Patescibacteria group bacterium]
MDQFYQLLGWVEHYEREHSRQGTTIPVWLCNFDLVHAAVASGLLYEKGRAPLIPRLGMSATIYGLTQYGREVFAAMLPRAGDPETKS